MVSERLTGQEGMMKEGLVAFLLRTVLGNQVYRDQEVDTKWPENFFLWSVGACRRCRAVIKSKLSYEKKDTFLISWVAR